MYIKELHLRNFGKFNDKVIYLNDRMNIIYGWNEAGKSTVFYFIVGIFYGFYKPYMKSRRLLDIYEKYRPWDGGGYSGSLLFYDELTDRDIRIERNFEQGNEGVNVFVESTGEEITSEYTIHPVFKLPDVAAKHLGVSYTTFINTLAIQQLGHATDDHLDRELKETVVNALTTHQLDVSVSKVHEQINKKLDAIGSNRRKTSWYYIQKKKIEELKKEREESEKVQEDVYGLRIEMNNLVEQEAVLNKEINRLKSCLRYIEAEKKDKIYKNGLEISASIERLKREIKSLNIDEAFTYDMLDQGLEMYHKMQFIKTGMEETKKRMLHIEQEIKQLNDKAIEPIRRVTQDAIEGLTQDMAQIDEWKVMKERHYNSCQMSEQKLEGIQSQIEKLSGQKRLFARHSIISLSLGAVGVISALWGLSMFRKTPIFSGVLGAGLLLIVGGLFFMQWTGMQKKKLEVTEDDLQKDLNREKKSVQNLLQEVDKIERSIDKLFSEYSVNNLSELMGLKDRWITDSIAYESNRHLYTDKMEQVKRLKKELDKEHENYESLEKQYKHMYMQIEVFLHKGEIKSEDDFKHMKEQYQLYSQLKVNLSHEEIRLADTLKGLSLNALEKERQMYQETEREVDLTIVKEENPGEQISEEWEGNLKDQIKDKENQIREWEKEVSAHTSKMETMMMGKRSTAAIEEELSEAKERFKSMEFDKEVYETVKETIDTITDELQHNFAPKLNETVSKIVGNVTDGRYQEVKINPQMMMRIKDPKSKRIINATDLSVGTLDLFYIALRQALASWITGKDNLPLLLDETFAHFDDQRLDQVLHVFNKLNTQIILFTCQERELRWMKESQVKHRVGVVELEVNA